MNQEWAIDPACAEAGVEFRMLVSHLGFTEGVLVSKFPSDWVARAYHSAAGLNEPEKTRVCERIRRIKDSGAILPSGRDFDNQMDWLANARHQHEAAPFDQVVAKEASPGCSSISEIDSFDWSTARGARLPGTCANFVSSLKLLLRVSNTVILLDPYFAPGRRENRQLFNEILGVTFNAKCKEFVIYVRADNWQYRKENCEYELKKLLAVTWEGTRRITVVCFDDSDPESKQHARYIFSERGGVRLDKGLQVDKAQVDFSIIEKPVHDELMKSYVERPLDLAVDYRVSFLA